MSYHYVDSGLDNVWLEDGYTIHQTPYGEGVSIHNTDGLHKAIGRCLIAIPKPLNGAELRFLRLEMELTQKAIAGLLNADEQAIRRWEKARTKPFNGSADRLLRVIYKEFADGDGSVRAMVKRLEELDQVEPTKIRFRETERQGWQPQFCEVTA